MNNQNGWFNFTGKLLKHRFYEVFSDCICLSVYKPE